MIRLAAVLYVLIFTVLAGVGVTALLSMNLFVASQIVWVALASLIVALPITWVVARQVFNAVKMH